MSNTVYFTVTKKPLLTFYLGNQNEFARFSLSPWITFHQLSKKKDPKLPFMLYTFNIKMSSHVLVPFGQIKLGRRVVFFIFF